MSEAPRDAPPAYFGLEITRRCNLRCPHCFTDSEARAPAGPDAERLSELFDGLVEAGVRVVAFSGGEPLLRRDLEALMHDGRRRGIESFRIVTNGSLVTRERARSLRAAGVTMAQVSLDGVDAVGHAAVRGCSPAEYYRALRAVRLLREAGLSVDIATIITPRNVERVAEMALMAQAIGVRALRYCTFVPTGRATDEGVRDSFATTPEQLDGFLDFLRKLNNEPNRPLSILIDHGIGPWDGEGRFACGSGRDVAYADVFGDLYPCPGLVYAPFRVGNVFSESVGELLRSPAMGRVRRIGRDELHGDCGLCSHVACSGGCRGQAFAESGDVYGSPAYCNVRRRSTEA